MNRPVLVISLLLPLLFIFVIGLGLHSGLPAKRGDLVVDGLADKVTLRRDRHAVVHIEIGRAHV